MKVATKSLRNRRQAPPTRATLTLNLETYRKIDALRGEATRSAYVQALIEQEEARRERKRLADSLRVEYTPKVCRETLALNNALPIHEG